MASILIKAKCNTELKDPEGKTPMDWAMEKGNIVPFHQMLSAHQSLDEKSRFQPVILASLIDLFNSFILGLC